MIRNQPQKVAQKVEPGLEGFCERIVSHDLTLSQVNKDWPAVFSTPAMIGMMELACSHAVRQALPAGSITVGVRVEVDHLKAVPAGATVIAFSKLVETNGRQLIFEVEARSGEELIGRGRIFHTIVEHSRFVANASKKLATR
jgi:fluoroacetyl-CoA thioesterase